MKFMKTLLKKGAMTAGYDIQRRTPGTNDFVQLVQSLQHFGIDFVVDVGANVGQFARSLRHAGYEDTILSIEPLLGPYTDLARAAEGDAKWRVHERCAVGDRDGEVLVNVSGNSVSSSILPMTTTHMAAAHGSAYVAQEMTKLSRLDSILPEYLQPHSRPFLKVDTQGSEWQVLDGCTEMLHRIAGILIELSMVELYDGQRLWTDVLNRLDREGFQLWSLNRGFTDVRTGRVLQVDATVFRM